VSSNHAYLAAIAGGAVLWQATAMFGGRREAWDSSLYWILAYPIGLVLAGVIGYLHPDRPWRWGLALMWTQAVLLTVSASSFGLLPLGMIMFGVLAIPPMAVATIVGSTRRRALNKAKAD
jgi:peptidoglycan/LPS O-acetylase OafA/YrhL